jgi:hypothetical protein
LQILPDNHIVTRLAVRFIKGCHPFNFATGGKIYP